MTDKPVLTADELRVAIGGRILCRRLRLQLQAGQYWGLLGRNGAGKTTLLHTLAGMRVATGGRVLLDEREITGLPRRAVAQQLGLLLQDHDYRFPVQVLDTVLSGRYAHLGPWSWPGREDRERARAALDSLGLAHLAQRNIQTLSGGERQRVAIATLLTQSPRILLMDEAVSHLDLREQVRILSLMRRLADRGHTVVMSLHEPNHALAYCDHLLLLHKQRALHGPTERLGKPQLLSRLFDLPLVQLQGPRGPLVIPDY